MKKENVAKFWNANPCATWYTSKKWGSKEFYRESEKLRYEKFHPHLKKTAGFKKWGGKSVLEIGVGIGMDAKQFAMHGAKYTGIDLTPNAVKITKQLFKTFNLKGKFLVADAEKLPFKNNSFDLVYSHGVLHHTPHTSRAIREVYRVLKPGGQAIIMLYYKHSFHYLVDICIYRYLLRLGFIKNSLQELLNEHSDGKGNPLSKVYSKKGMRKLFRRFHRVKIKIRYLEFPRIVEKILPKRFKYNLSTKMGWHIFAFATKHKK